MKAEDLIDALDLLQERYEEDERDAEDTLERLRLRAQINVVRDLRLVLQGAKSETDTKGADSSNKRP